jgi:hypothetical protein
VISSRSVAREVWTHKLSHGASRATSTRAARRRRCPALNGLPAPITGRQRRKDPICGALRPRFGNKPAFAAAQHGSGLFPVPAFPVRAVARTSGQSAAFRPQARRRPAVAALAERAAARKVQETSGPARRCAPRRLRLSCSPRPTSSSRGWPESSTSCSSLPPEGPGAGASFSGDGPAWTMPPARATDRPPPPARRPVAARPAPPTPRSARDGRPLVGSGLPCG